VRKYQRRLIEKNHNSGCGLVAGITRAAFKCREILNGGTAGWFNGTNR